MRQNIAIILLILIILANIGLQELKRIPVLLEHFAEHKERNCDMSFIGFIVLHYFSGDGKDTDYQRDRQLPFRGSHCEESFVAMAIPADSFVALVPRTPGTPTRIGLYVSPWYSSLYKISIWQPPRA